MTAGDDRVALSPWEPPEPRQVPELRAELRDYLRTKDQLRTLGQAVNAGRTAIFPIVREALTNHSVGVVAAPLLAALERKRLAEATLYYASSDMTSLAVAAASTPPTETVRRSRLPSPTGFMVFAEPIGGYTENLAAGPVGRIGPGDEIEVTTPIVAVSWSTWTPHDVAETGVRARVEWVNNGPDGLALLPDDMAGVWLTFYAAGADTFSALPPDAVVGTNPDGSPILAGQVVARHRGAARRPPLTWDNEIILGYGAKFGESVADTTEEWAQVVYTAWQLMTQAGRTRLAELEEVRRDRAGRRRDQRAGMHHSDVRIVRLHAAHRPSREATERDAAASSGRRAPQWTCRWPVRPYRRNTCLNSRAHPDGCTHEEQIIPAHVKGPADKPLRVAETVHLWDSVPGD